MDQGKICVVGATTHPNLMPKPLLDRFVLQEELLAYENGDLAKIVRQASQVEITEEACQAIARASMGTPRKALSLLASAGDLRLAKGENAITIALVKETLRRKRLDSLGLVASRKRESPVTYVPSVLHEANQAKEAVTPYRRFWFSELGRERRSHSG